MRQVKYKRNRKPRIASETENAFGFCPFSSLDSKNLPELPSEKVKPILPESMQWGKIGKGVRLEVRREKSVRAGKTVTTVRGFPNEFDKQERQKLLASLKNKLGTGGSCMGNGILLQGDRRSEVVDWLRALGFQPLLAGG